MEYYTIMTSFKYYPFVRRLTRVTDQSQNSTYHTWTNESHIVLKAVLVVYDLFDNFWLFADINQNIIVPQKKGQNVPNNKQLNIEFCDLKFCEVLGKTDF